MRDVLIHGYFGVNIETVWNAIENLCENSSNTSRRFSQITTSSQPVCLHQPSHSWPCPAGNQYTSSEDRVYSCEATLQERDKKDAEEVVQTNKGVRQPVSPNPLLSLVELNGIEPSAS